MHRGALHRNLAAQRLQLRGVALHALGTGLLGLGLAIGRAIIERHGGTIRASSTPGEGTTITIWLPQRRTADRDDRP